MQKFLDWIEKRMGPVAQWMGANAYLRAITTGTLCTLPLTLIAGVATIVAKPPIPLENGVPTMLSSWYYWGEQQSWLLQLNTVYQGIIGIVFLVGMIVALSERFKLNAVTNTGIAIGAYFIVISAPMNIVIESGKLTVSNFGAFGSSGIFPSIMLGIIIIQIVKLFKEKEIGFKFPSAVPEYVSNSFNAILPAFVITVIVIGLNAVSHMLFGVGMADIIKTLFAPLVQSFDNVLVVGLFMGAINLFWYLGIHGGSIISPIITPIGLAYVNENLAAYAAGVDIPHFYTNVTRFSLILIGGGGIFALALLNNFSKSKTLRNIGKVGIIPAIFNISEPTMFGTPVVYNTDLFVPFIIVPFVNTFLAWFATDIIKVISGPYLAVPSQTPVVLIATLGHGSIVAGIVAVGIIIVNILMYLPFYKRYEAKMIIDEQAELKKGA